MNPLPSTLLQVSQHTLSIAFFVFSMMLLVEYINSASGGKWQTYFCERTGWQQYFLAASLGITPGCLGAFTAVTLYSHRMLSLGALVATMIATSGDEAFVMFALFPGDALVINIILFALAIPAALLTDTIFKTQKPGIKNEYCLKLEVHASEATHDFSYIKAPLTLHTDRVRLVLSLCLILLITLLVLGYVGPVIWNWKRITFILIATLGFWIVLTSSQHFLHEHVWAHLVKEHLPQLVGWTFLALLAIQLIDNALDLDGIIRESQHLIVLLAAITGLIPASGPHLIFVGLYAKELIPLLTLVVSSIVQDGHGMLPLLAFNRVDFLKVKSINLIYGLLVAGIWLLVQNQFL